MLRRGLLQSCSGLNTLGEGHPCLSTMMAVEDPPHFQVVIGWNRNHRLWNERGLTRTRRGKIDAEINRRVGVTLELQPRAQPVKLSHVCPSLRDCGTDEFLIQSIWDGIRGSAFLRSSQPVLWPVNSR